MCTALSVYIREHKQYQFALMVLYPLGPCLQKLASQYVVFLKWIRMCSETLKIFIFFKELAVCHQFFLMDISCLACSQIKR